MNEYDLQMITFLKIIWVSIFSYLYALGGISNKWIRRFISPCFFMLGVFIFSKWLGTWSNVYLISLPLMIISFHKGYGGDTFEEKMDKRLIYALLLITSTFPLALAGHSLPLYILSGFITLITVVVLGVFNIAKSSRNEETLIAFLSYILPMFLI